MMHGPTNIKSLRCSFTGIEQAYTDLTYSKEQSNSWAISRSRNYPYFLETEGSSPGLQEPATCSYSEPVHTTTSLSLQVHFSNSLTTAISEPDLYMLLTSMYQISSSFSFT